MRIIGGEFRSRRLQFHMDGVRPTKDRVRESIFNMIDVSEKSCLDAFSGTGACGIESLSRGASHVAFVDIDTRLVFQNLESISPQKIGVNADVYRKSIFDFLERGRACYDVIFLDPPWDHLDYFDKSLNAIFDFDILTPQGKIVCEKPKAHSLSCDIFNVLKSRTYGKTEVLILNHHEKSHISR